ncbi:MAG TPA: transposase [Bryobacteraceae bacterium]|nr:transposase [Bryobacteraceae bacterium]
MFDLSSEVLDKVTDARPQPLTSPTLVLKSALAMFWAHLGSLNALQTVSAARFWKRWLEREPISADTMGRAHTVLNVTQLRDGLHQVYRRLKRNKALPLNLGLDVAVLDGHEQHASYRRHCAGCRQRTVKTEHGERIQYYHRQASAGLVGLRTDASRRGRSLLRHALTHPCAVRRQLDRTVTQETSAWVWVTTVPQSQAPTVRVVYWGHQRWDIENLGFNELGNGWEADHIYKHKAQAIEAFLLVTFLAYNIFHAFIGLNLKPQLRDTKPAAYWVRLIVAELYRGAGRTTYQRAP